MILSESAKQWIQVLLHVAKNWLYIFFLKTFDIKSKKLIGGWLSLSNGSSSFLWIGVISANFKGPGNSPVLKDLFIHLGRTCGNIFFCFKNLEGMTTPDDFVSANVEISLRTSLVVTGQKEKALNVMYLFLTFFMLGWFLYLLTILLIGSCWFKESDESGHLKNPGEDVMDRKWILNSTSVSSIISMFSEVFTLFFEKQGHLKLPPF